MSKNAYDLDEVKKRMHKRNKELDDEEKQLKNEEVNLRNSLVNLQNLRDEIEGGVTQQRLKVIVNELNMKARVKFPYVKLVRYFALKNVDRKLKDMRLLLRQIPDRIELIKSEREDVNICPSCGGLGSKVQHQYIREDGLVTPVTKSSECSLCHGKGRIGLDEPL
jgi:uncharacterized protein YhaN